MDNMGSCVPRVDGILESLPLQNHGAVEAAMAILSPVRGFCRRGASRAMVAKVPNPAMVTRLVREGVGDSREDGRCAT